MYGMGYASIIAAAVVFKSYLQTIFLICLWCVMVDFVHWRWHVNYQLFISYFRMETSCKFQSLFIRFARLWGYYETLAEIYVAHNRNAVVHVIDHMRNNVSASPSLCNVCLAPGEITSVLSVLIHFATEHREINSKCMTWISFTITGPVWKVTYQQELACHGLDWIVMKLYLSVLICIEI